MQSRETRFVLCIESGERTGERIPLPDGVVRIGRKSECEVTLADASVSGRHAELRVGSARVELADLGSTNGTRVDGKRVEEATLSHGDEIVFGSVKARLHDSSLAGAAPAVEEPASDLLTSTSPAGDAGGALGHVSAEKLSRSGGGSKKFTLVLCVALLLVGGGAVAYLKLVRGGAAKTTLAAVPEVPGNLLKDGSFEDGSGEWTSTEEATVSFLRERAFATSGAVGLGARMADGEWSLARSEEFVLPARRSIAASASVRIDEFAVGRLGVQLTSASEDLPSFIAWAPAVRATGQAEEVRLAFDVTGGYDRGRLVIAGHGNGAVALDDVAVLAENALGRAAKYTEYELPVLGSPGSTAMLVRSGQVLLAGISLSSWSRAGLEGWPDAQLAAQAGQRGFTLSFPGLPKDARLGFRARRPEDGRQTGWVATTGPDGYTAHGPDFEREGVTSLLLGAGTELVRIGFERPVAVSGAGVEGALRISIELRGLDTCELQLSFGEERAEAATLADRARDQERRGQLGEALATWTELLDRFPYERGLVTQASEARARLVKTGLDQVDQLRRDIERARFFELPELFQMGKQRAMQLAVQYGGSEVEQEALETARTCDLALEELTSGQDSGEAERLKAVLEALDSSAAPQLSEHVREALSAVDRADGGD